jgi:hypothetical protein
VADYRVSILIALLRRWATNVWSQRSVLAFVLALSVSSEIAFAQKVQPWPPSDPDEEVTQTPFTVEWAKTLRGFKTIADLQKAAGSKGHISERDLSDHHHPSVGFHWRSQPSSGGPAGWMLATIFADGGIGVTITTIDGLDITVNNFGAFICGSCAPPENVVGRKPSWSR